MSSFGTHSLVTGLAFWAKTLAIALAHILVKY